MKRFPSRVSTGSSVRARLQISDAPRGKELVLTSCDRPSSSRPGTSPTPPSLSFPRPFSLPSPSSLRLARLRPAPRSPPPTRLHGSSPMHPHPSKLVGLSYVLTRTAGALVLLPAPDRIEGSSVAVPLDDLRGVESRGHGRVLLTWTRASDPAFGRSAASGVAELELADPGSAARLCGRLAGMLGPRKTRHPQEADERATDRAAAVQATEKSPPKVGHCSDVAWDAQRLHHRCGGLSFDAADVPTCTVTVERRPARGDALAAGEKAFGVPTEPLDDQARTLIDSGAAHVAVPAKGDACALSASRVNAQAKRPLRPPTSSPSPPGSRGPLRLSGVPRSHPIVRLLSFGERSDDEAQGNNERIDDGAKGNVKLTDQRDRPSRSERLLRGNLLSSKLPAVTDATSAGSPRQHTAESVRLPCRHEMLHRMLSVRPAEDAAVAPVFLEATWQFTSDTKALRIVDLLSSVWYGESCARLARTGPVGLSLSVALLGTIASVAGAVSASNGLSLLAIAISALAVWVCALPGVLESRAETSSENQSAGAKDDERLGVLELRTAKWTAREALGAKRVPLGAAKDGNVLLDAETIAAGGSSRTGVVPSASVLSDTHLLMLEESSLSAVSVRSRSEDERVNGSDDVPSLLDADLVDLRARLRSSSLDDSANEPTDAAPPLALSPTPPNVPSPHPAPLPLPGALFAFAEANPREIDRDTLVRFHRAMDGDEARASAALGRLVSWLDANDARGLVERPQPFFSAIKKAWAHGILCRTRDGQHVVTIEAMGKLPKALAELGAVQVEVPLWALRSEADSEDAQGQGSTQGARDADEASNSDASSGCAYGCEFSAPSGDSAPGSIVQETVAKSIGRSEALLHLAFLNAYIATHVDPRPWPGGQVVRILDAEGLGFGDLRSEGFKLVMDAAGMLGVTQPQRLHRAFVVNAPMWWAAAWKLISPLMETKVSEKFRIFRKGDPKAREALLELVREEDLPTSLGGFQVCPLEDGVFERALRAHVDALNAGGRADGRADGGEEKECSSSQSVAEERKELRLGDAEVGKVHA